MKYIFGYKESKKAFDRWMMFGKNDILSAESFLYSFDESTLEEGERLSLILCPIQWAVDHDCMTEWFSDELRLYYRQMVDGELDDVIDTEEREEVKRILTECFKKAFPGG